jgi:uncharacterized cupredoxin-like copper-binding protein
MRHLSARSVSALAAITIAASAFAPIAPAVAASGTKQATTTVQVKGGEFFFKLSKKSLAKPGKVSFVLTNVGQVPHDFKIAGKKTPLVNPGKKATLVVTLKKGKFPYMCTVPGHAAAGMKGTFTVA